MFRDIMKCAMETRQFFEGHENNSPPGKFRKAKMNRVDIKHRHWVKARVDHLDAEEENGLADSTLRHLKKQLVFPPYSEDQREVALAEWKRKDAKKKVGLF